mmetsp:Transcript_39650/g.105046  ORF Transcript_39650/g.105046 Transcript_39650/m.105046 type:complete len:100 (-) Transcript_39650:215-514(-)
MPLSSQSDSEVTVTSTDSVGERPEVTQLRAMLQICMQEDGIRDRHGSYKQFVRALRDTAEEWPTEQLRKLEMSLRRSPRCRRGRVRVVRLRSVDHVSLV